MLHITRIGVVTLYVLLIGFCVELMLAVAGVYISWLTCISTMAGWCLFCFLSIYLLSPLHLFFHGRLRKPIREEEMRLQACLTEVLKAVDSRRKFRIRIVEGKETEAFSFGPDIIAISVTLLDRLTDDELKGILANELGHILSRDTILSWSFATAGYVPRRLRHARIVWMALLLLPLLFFIVGFFSNKLIFPIAALWLFLLTSIVLDVLFRWVHRLLLRQCEYSRDAFAYRIGYGRGLRDALIKLAKTPMSYSRIRRLEKLLYQ